MFFKWSWIPCKHTVKGREETQQVKVSSTRPERHRQGVVERENCCGIPIPLANGLLRIFSIEQLLE